MSIELGKLLVMKYYNNVYSFTLKKRSFFFLEIFSIQEAKLCLKKKKRDTNLTLPWNGHR